MTARKKVVLYPRVSSQKQLDNDSLPTQVKEMRRWAERERYEVVGVFEERGKSAKTTDRPALQKMLSWIKAHPGEVDAVLVYDFKRLARKTADHLAIRARLDRSKVKLISATEPVSDDPFGWFQERLHANLSELDNDMRAQRTRVGMTHAVEEGRWCHQAPVGYLNCGRNGRPSLRPDPDRSSVVVEAFTRVARGEAPQSVYEDLCKRGFGTRRGGTIGRQTFYTVLRNPVYKGQLVTKLGISDGNWEPLIEPATWEQVQSVVGQGRLRDASTPTSQKPGKRPYLRVRKDFELRSWLSCAVCGRKITGGATKGHNYLNCPAGHVRARADVLNERFSFWLDAVRPNDIFLRRLESAIRRELEQQKNELIHRRAVQGSAVRALEDRLERLNLALSDGAMDRDAYTQTYQKLKSELQVLKHRGVEDDLEQLDVDATLLFARQVLARPGRLWADATPEDKIQLQRSLFPSGLHVDAALEFSTDPSRHHSMTYLLFSGVAKGMASPTGFEPVS